MEVKGWLPLNITDEKTLFEGKSERKIWLTTGAISHLPDALTLCLTLDGYQLGFTQWKKKK